MREQKMNQNKRVRKRKKNRPAFGTQLKLMDRKMAFLYLFLFLLFFILLIRVGYLQTVESESLTRDALAVDSVRNKKNTRGLIVDSSGKELVSNISKSDIYVDTKTLLKSKNSAKHKEQLINLAEKSLDMTKEEAEKRLEKSGHVLFKGNVDRSSAMRIRDTDIPGVVVEDFEARSYPYNDLASLIIGFTNKEGEGRYGLERYYNDTLNGDNAILSSQEDPSSVIDGGASLKLTVSEPLQRKTEEILDNYREKNQAKRITAIVQETQTGAVAAMASTDDYNLNDPYRPATKAQKAVWKDLSQEQKSEMWFDNWRNFSISDTYEPGSTFKTITAAAAIEESTTNPKKHYYCTGYVRDIPGITITCTSLPNPHGDITMDKAFAESCNISFISIARELSKEGMLKYIRAFGFGEKTGIDLPAEQEGMIPESEEKIGDARLATMSYGHGIAVTPIQMVTAISAVANGGYLLEPYVVDEITDAAGNLVEKHGTVVRRQVVSESTSNTMRNLMVQVVEKGTGKYGAVDRYLIGGKTGTAGKVSETGGYEKDKYISSFVSVGPMDDPKYTVLVIVEEPEGDYFGATVAAPIASEIMNTALRSAEIPFTTGMKEKKAKKVIVPNVENMLLEDAGKTLTDVGLKFNMASENVGAFGIVEKQAPKAGTEVEEDTIVDLKIDPNDANRRSVPNLLGKSKGEVERLLENSNIDYIIEGEGAVVSQEPLAGEELQKGMKVRLHLEEKMSSDEENKEKADSESGEEVSDQKNSKTKPSTKQKKAQETSSRKKRSH